MQFFFIANAWPGFLRGIGCGDVGILFPQFRYNGSDSCRASGSQDDLQFLVIFMKAEDTVNSLELRDHRSILML